MFPAFFSPTKCLGATKLQKYLKFFPAATNLSRLPEANAFPPWWGVIGIKVFIELFKELSYELCNKYPPESIKVYPEKFVELSLKGEGASAEGQEANL